MAEDSEAELERRLAAMSADEFVSIGWASYMTGGQLMVLKRRWELLSGQVLDGDQFALLMHGRPPEDEEE
jgi:hypothetical protein